MKAYVCKTPIGYFALDNEKNILYYELFEKNPKQIADKLKEDIPKSFFDKLDYEVKEDNFFMKDIIRQRAKELLQMSDIEFNELLTKIGIYYSKSLAKSGTKRDKLIVQSSNTLDDLKAQINVFSEHIREWFGLHDSETKQDIEKYCDFIIDYNQKESTGIDLEEDDLIALKNYATFIKNSLKTEKELESYIKKSMKEVCPNISSLIDPVLGARLISHTGSLENLAKLSSSSVQLIGAEKALFRHLKNRKINPPKYGLIYLSGWVQKVKPNNRGKVARFLSAKLMLAARIDFYSDRFEPKLKKDLENEIKKAGFL